MWKLDYKERWVPKNWCFWTVVLGKTLESPLDSKEIQPVHPKGDQSWVLIWGLMMKLKLQYLGHLMQRADSFEKTLMLGKIEGRRIRGWLRMRWLDGITNSTDMSLLKLMSIELVMLSKHLILCYPLLLPPSIFPSIRVFSNESALCIRWPKYWSFSFNIGPSNEYSGLISFRMDWLDLPEVQGTLKSLLQYHSSKASILQHSAFFIVQLSHPYMTTEKTKALTRWTFVG